MTPREFLRIAVKPNLADAAARPGEVHLAHDSALMQYFHVAVLIVSTRAGLYTILVPVLCSIYK